MTDKPKLTREQAAEIVDAVRAGNAIVCYSKCWPCGFGDHCDEPHTWMDDEDAAHAGLSVPKTPQERAALAADRPCGCNCNARNREVPR